MTGEGHLVGLLRSNEDLHGAHRRRRPSADWWSDNSPAVVANPDTSIRDVANRMVAKDLRYVPVISEKSNEGKLLGVITLNDIARQRFAEEVD